MDFSASSIFASLLFGSVGIFVFRKGKKDSDLRVVFAGIALMIYPYFINGEKLMWGIGIALSGLSYYLIKNPE